MKILRITLAVVGLALVVALGAASWTVWRWPHPPTTRVRMKSGREIDVSRTGQIDNVTPPVWAFEYRSRSSWRTYEEVRREVATVWPDIEEQAERSAARKAFVMPVSFAVVVRFDGWRPFVSSDTLTAVTFEKDGEGTWRMK